MYTVLLLAVVSKNHLTAKIVLIQHCLDCSLNLCAHARRVLIFTLWWQKTMQNMTVIVHRPLNKLRGIITVPRPDRTLRYALGRMYPCSTTNQRRQSSARQGPLRGIGA